MTTAKEVFGEIKDVTAGLIACGLCVDQNFPSLKSEVGGITHISVPLVGDLSVTLKNAPYNESYIVLREDRSYNLKLIDGGLLQLFYTFEYDLLVEHRLAFFPSPDLLDYQNSPEIYELDEIYADVIARNIVSSPLRFDFDRKNFQPVEHPMCHLTIGQYKNCRIPVSSPLTPLRFCRFILSSFYSRAFGIMDELPDIRRPFDETIHQSEVLLIHIRG